jgi:hypothetical protein
MDRRDPAPSAWWLALYAGNTLAFGVFAALLLRWVVDTKVIEHLWLRGQAEVVAVTGTRGSGGRRSFDLRLRVSLPDGGAVVGNTIRPHPLRVSWTVPKRVPQPGDRMEVMVDPDDSSRVVTVGGLGLPGFAAAFGVMALAVCVASLCFLIGGSRRRYGWRL